MKRLFIAALLLPANLAFAQEVSPTYDAASPTLAEMAQQEAYATYPQAPAYVQPHQPAPVQQAQPAPQHQPVNPVEMFYYSAPTQNYDTGGSIAPISNLNF